MSPLRAGQAASKSAADGDDKYLYFEMETAAEREPACIESDDDEDPKISNLILCTFLGGNIRQNISKTP